MHPPRTSLLLIFGWFAAIAALGGVFFLMSQRRAAVVPHQSQTLFQAPEPEPQLRAASIAQVSALEPVNDTVAIMPPRADDRIPKGLVHPHPITPEHERIFQANRYIGELNGAMDVGDAPGMRRALAQYEKLYPDDPEDVQTGYAIIADCLEHRNADSRAAAVRWSDAHHGSTVKRFVNRHCLE